MLGRLFFRFLIFGLAAFIIARALRSFAVGIRSGFSTGKPVKTPEKGQAMARDPVCGTFVVPAHALTARGKSGQVYFCSDKCRQAYQTRS